MRTMIVFKYLALLLVASFASPVFGQEVNFRFNPPDDLTYLQKFSSTKTKKIDDGQTQIDIVNSDAKISFLKTADGYEVKAEIISMKMERDGQVIENPVWALMQKLVFTYHLDSTGNLMEITGFDEFADWMKQSLPPEAVKALSKVLNKEALLNKEIAEWEGRIGLFIGLTVNIGDTWTDTTDFVLPNGETIIFYNTTIIDELVEFNGKNCVRIKFQYTSDPENLSSVVKEVVEGVMSAVSDTAVKLDVSTNEIIGEGERIIDPSTMLIQWETIKRTIKMIMSIPGEGEVSIVTHEERIYTFEY